ncbi:hypothetical protein HN937_22630, partial [Candidatus Poribacteria bacterium]|nr:hypothetical protein [Candidatus Poribacteria bacterium]
EALSLKLRTRRSRPNSLLKQQRIDNPLGVFGLCMVVAEMAAQIADDDDGKASWLEYHAPWVVDNPGAAIQEMHESLVELVGGDEWGNEVAFDATITGLLEDHGFAAPEEIVAADVEIDHDEAVLAESNDMIMNGPSDALDGYQNDFRVVNPDDPRVDDVYTWAENYEPEDRGTVMVTFRGRRTSKAAFLSLPLSMNTQDELRTLVDEVRTVRLTDLKAISFDAFGEFYDNRRLAKRNIVLRRVHTATPQERHVAEAAYAMWDKNHTVRKGGLKSVDGGVRVTWMKGGMYPDAFDSLCRAIVKNAPDNPTIIPSTNDNGNTVWTIVAGLDPEETQVRVVSDDVVTVKVAPKPVTYEIGERQVPTVGMIDTRNLR